MGIVNVVLGEDTRLNLILGQQLENAVTSVVFDFSAWKATYGTGTLALSVQRPGDEMPYAVALTTSGTNATWSVTNLDTAYKGVGHIQLTYTVGTAIKKSVVYKFTVYESLGANGEYPSPGQTWQQNIEAEIGTLSNLPTTDKSSLVASINEIDGDITDVKQDLNFATGIDSIKIPAVNQGKYLKITDNVVDVEHPQTSSSGYGYVIVPCEEGNIFTVNGVSSGNYPLAWVFTDGNYEIKAKADGNITVTNAIITAPADAEWLIIHDKTPYRLSYTGESNVVQLNEVKKAINEKLDAYTVLQFTETGKSIGSESGSYRSVEGDAATLLAPCLPGQVVKWHGQSWWYSNQAQSSCVAFYDKNKTFMPSTSIKQVDDSSATTNKIGDIIAVVPEGARYVAGSSHTVSSAFPTMRLYNVSDKIKEVGDLNALDTYSKDSVVSAINEVDYNLTNRNSIKYLYEANNFSLISGTYSESGAVSPNNNRIRSVLPIECDSDFYAVFVPGTIITDVTFGKKESGESTYSNSDWLQKYITKFNAGCSIIPVFRSQISGSSNPIKPSDFDALFYIVSEKDMMNYQVDCYSRLIENYAYQDDSKISSATGGILSSLGWILSAYIPTTVGSEYLWMPGSSASQAFVGIYDSSKNFISSYSNIGKPRLITMPANASYMRVSLMKESGSRICDISGKTIFAYNAIGQLYNEEEPIPDNDYEVMPSDWPHEVGYRKSQQYTDIKWTPKHDVPRALVNGGDSEFPAGVERTGMLYSDVYGTNKVIGFDVSVKTFMTAVNNPHSLLYTENCNPQRSNSSYGIIYTYGDADTAAYFGTACNHFVMHSLGSPISYSSYDVRNHAGEYGYPFEKVYDQSANGLELLDILCTDGHMILVTRLWKTKRGVVTRVGIAQAGENGANNSGILTANQFNQFIKTAGNNGYDIYRYKDLYKNIYYEKSPFVAIENETIESYEYNDDICTYAGDYACFAEGDLLHINYAKGDYTAMEIYKNDVLIDTITLDASPSVYDVDLTNENYTYGKYKARLKNGNVYSDYTYWEILNAEISLSGDTLSVSSENAVPLFWSWTKTNGYTYKKVKISDGQTSVDVSDKDAEYPEMKVVFQGDYGRIARIIT